jgi:hypothetical protein
LAAVTRRGNTTRVTLCTNTRGYACTQAEDVTPTRTHTNTRPQREREREGGREREREREAKNVVARRRGIRFGVLVDV